VNISGARGDISGRGTPFFHILRGLSDGRRLFLVSYTL